MQDEHEASESDQASGRGSSTVAAPDEPVSRLDTHSRRTFAQPREQRPPPPWSELAGVFGLVAVCDLAIYRGQGFGGYALLFFVTPVLLWVSSSRRCCGPARWIVGAMLVTLAAKMAWCGSVVLVAIGFALIVSLAMALAGFRPYVLEAAFFASQVPHAGYRGLIHYSQQLKNIERLIPRAAWISFVLPLLALLVFGSIFILANPDLAVTFGQGVEQLVSTVRNWLDRFSPELLEIGFWLGALWVVLGLLHPYVEESQFTDPTHATAKTDNGAGTAEAFLYAAVRNTLVTVIVLFAVYLIFEFKTLWFQAFRPGFHYSGYAHEGAAWLTVALALATATLSLIFRGRILRDPRTSALRRLAWLWSLQNLILGVAVYNRLFLYIGFNGMSRMRIVGLYGISAVIVGFALVLWKIAHNRDFLWLVRRQMWTLAIAVYLLALTPLDTIVVGYNVRRILSGDAAPAVQISVHPISAEGILLLEPLLNCDDEIIREGVRALLAEHHAAAEATSNRNAQLGWTTFQLADRIALKSFRQQSARWQRYQNPDTRQQALDRFHNYAYQWY